MLARLILLQKGRIFSYVVWPGVDFMWGVNITLRCHDKSSVIIEWQIECRDFGKLIFNVYTLLLLVLSGSYRASQNFLSFSKWIFLQMCVSDSLSFTRAAAAAEV